MVQYCGMDGRAYLEKVIGDRLGSVRHLPEGSRTSSLNLPELEGIATGLIAAGALRPADAERILTDLRKTVARASAAVHRPVIVDSPVSTLVRVISLAGRTFAQGSVTTALVSLEVWSTMLILRSAMPSEHDWDPRTVVQFWDSGRRWRAWDDAGTQYRSTSGDSSSIHDMFVESRTFYPGPPEEARFLTVIVEHPEDHVAVELPLR